MSLRGHLSPSLHPPSTRNDSALTSPSPRKKRSLHTPPAPPRRTPPQDLSSSPILAPRQDFVPAVRLQSRVLSEDIFSSQGPGTLWRRRAADLGLSSDEDDAPGNAQGWGFASPRKGGARTETQMPRPAPDSDSDDELLEREWPPSPKKSPVKRRLVFGRQERELDRTSFGFRDISPVEGRDLVAALPKLEITKDEPVHRSRKGGRRSLMRKRRTSAGQDSGETLAFHKEKDVGEKVVKPEAAAIGSDGQADSAPSEVQTEAVSHEANLWKACGYDLERWNRGDFDIGNELGIEPVRW